MRFEVDKPLDSLPPLSKGTRKSLSESNNCFTIHPISCQTSPMSTNLHPISFQPIPISTNQQSVNPLGIGVPVIQGYTNATPTSEFSWARQDSPTETLSELESLNLQSPNGATRPSVNSRFPTLSVSPPATIHSPALSEAFSSSFSDAFIRKRSSGSSSDNSRSWQGKRPYNRVAEIDKGAAYQKRRERNRRAVEKCRAEKKERDAKQQKYYDELEAKCRQLDSKLDKVQKECEVLRVENARLRAENPRIAPARTGRSPPFTFGLLS